MTTSTTFVSGRITQIERRQGIQGLEVEVWSTDPMEDACLGRGLTSATGEYRLAIDEKLIEKGKTVYLTVRDRTGKLVQTTADRGRRLSRGKRVSANLRIDGQLLLDHFREPVGFEGRGQPLVPPGATGDIDAAVHMMMSPGEPGFNRFRNAALCPFPPFELFDQLRDDAFGVIGGELDAEIRFLDTVSALEHSLPGGAGRRLFEDMLGEEIGRDSDFPNRFQAVMRAARGEQGGTPQAALAALTTSRLEPQRPISNAALPIERAVKNAGFGRGGPTVPMGAAAPILHAAAMLGGSTLRSLDLVGGALAGLCGFETFGAIHRGAVDVLNGRPGGGQRFRSLVGFWGGECGPDDGPLPPFPHRPRPCLPDDLDKINCAIEAVQFWRQHPRGQYRITDVQPRRACPGDQIVITGTNFGTEPSPVRFKGHSGAAGINVDAATWSDTQITATVPNGAGCGVSLRILEGTVRICGRFVDVYRRGVIDVDFGGTSPEILSFFVTRFGSEVCLEPGETATVRWDVCAADQIRVELVDENGAVLQVADPAPASGTLTHPVPSSGASERWEARLHATGTCAPPASRTIIVHTQHPVDLRIDGIEVTQSIQYYRAAQHLTDSNDRGPDNSVQLVTGKTTWVRVYVRSGQSLTWDNGQLTNVTGTLLVERMSGGLPTFLATLNPQPPGSVTAEANPGYDQERRDINATVNFVVPANLVSGRLRFTANVSSEDAYCGRDADSDTTTVDVDLQQTLNIAGILIGYNGPDGAGNNLTLNPPTLAQLQTTAALTIAVFPVADAVSFRNAGNFTQTVPLTDPLQANGSGCTPNWDAFMNNVRNVVNADGNQPNTVYYGLMANGIPMGPVVGCGGGGLGTGGVLAQGTMAHEVGHALGLAHGPCGGAPQPDPNYPAYEPYDPANAPQGLIGEYGLDNRNGNVSRPPTNDLMTYCGGWISLYHYNSLLNVALLNPTSVPAGLTSTSPMQPTTERQPVIDLLFQLDEDQSVRSVAVCRLETRPADDGARTDMTAELLDKKDEVLAAAPVLALDLNAGGCGCRGAAPNQPPRRLQASIPDVGRGAALRLRRGKDELWRRKAPEHAPKVAVERAKVRRDGRLDLGWKVESASDQDPNVWVRWSPDRGKTWRAVSVGLKGKAASLDLANIPGGKVRFQVMVHDGFSTATVETGDLELPERAPSLAMLAPEEGVELDSRGGVRLWGSLMAVDGTPLEDPEAVWTIDGRQAAKGLDARIGPLSPGKHKVGLASRGQRQERTVVVKKTDA